MSQVPTYSPPRSRSRTKSMSRSQTKSMSKDRSRSQTKSMSTLSSRSSPPAKSLSVISRAIKKESESRKAKQFFDMAHLQNKIDEGSFVPDDLVTLAENMDGFEIIGHKDEAKLRNKFGDFFQYLPPGYRVSKKLGQGAYGEVYQICHNRLECLAIKLQMMVNAHDYYDDEFALQRGFAKVGLAPNIVGSPFFLQNADGQHICGCVMEKVHGTLYHLLQDEPLTDVSLIQITFDILYLLGRFRKADLTHGDFHESNIVYRFVTDDQGVLQIRLMVIDFGFSRKGANTKKDFVYFLYDHIYRAKILQHNRDFITKLLVPLLPFFGVSDSSEHTLEKEST